MEINYNYYWSAKDAINNVIGFIGALEERTNKGLIDPEYASICLHGIIAKKKVLEKAVQELEGLVRQIESGDSL